MCYPHAMLKSCLFPILMLALYCPAWADIYKHVDEHGNITFTNTPLKGAQRILIEPSHPPRAAAPNAPRNTASPSSFPRIDTSLQKERDISRRRILEEELASEQRLRDERKKALTDADTTRTAEEKNNPQKYLERLGRLRENLQLHEKNIAALQNELSKLR